MQKIERLTQAQIDRMPEFVEKWTKIGLSTDPADRPHAERSVRRAYEITEMNPPQSIVWTTSPLAQAIARIVVMSLTQGVGDSVRDSVRDSVMDSVWDSVRNSVWDSVRDFVWDSVGHSVGHSVRDSVWDSVWHSVWHSVGHSVRHSVWDSVGDSVRNSVRDSVWDSVGDSVRNSVRDSVRNSVGDSVYGQHDAGWLAFYDYMRFVVGLSKQTDPILGITGIAQSAGWWLPHKHICFISERHHRVCLNSHGQLHSYDGMAVQYPDGWGVWAWNGVRVTEQIILQPETLSPEQIAKEPNAQVRQVMVERVGIERVCQMFRATEQDRRGDYRLLLLDLGDGRKRPYLKMLNPSVGVWHVEGVHPNCSTVQEALNWRNGLSLEQIDEVNGADWIQQGDVILKPKGATKFKSQPIQLS